MTRSKKPVDPRWAPVPDVVLDHFAPAGMLDAADVEAATQRFKKACWSARSGRSCSII